MLGLAYGNGGRELRAISRPAWGTRVRPYLNGQQNTSYKCSLEHARKCVVGVATKQNGTPLVSHFPLVFIFLLSFQKEKENECTGWVCVST